MKPLASVVPACLAFPTMLLAASTLGLSVPARADWTPAGNDVVVHETDQNLAQAVPDGAGGAILLFLDRRNQVPFVNPCIDIFGQHVQVDGALAPGWTLDGSAVSTDGGALSLQRTVSDGLGGAFATARLNYYPVGGYGTAVLVQHVPKNGAASSGPDHWLLWSEYGAGGGGLAPDGAGGVYVAGHDAAQACASEDCQLKAYVGRFDAALNQMPGWPLRLRLGSGAQTDAELAGDAAHGVFALWRDERATPTDLYLQHVLPNGTKDPTWPADGRAMGSTVNGSVPHRILADGAGGVFAAWIDMRAGRNELYAQHVDATGAPVSGWPAGGLRVRGAAGLAVRSFLLQGDGALGALLSWTEQPDSGPRELRAIRLGASGAIASGWPASGRVVSAGLFPGSDSPIAAPGASSDLFLAWYDGSGPRLLRIDGAGADVSGWPAGGVLLPAGALALAPDPWGGTIVGWDVFTTSADLRALRVGADGAIGSLVGVGPGPVRSTAWTLGHALPNPTPAAASCALVLPVASRVDARVVDVRGRVVRVLFAGDTLPAGEHRLAWNGADRDGTPAAAGIYLLTVHIDGVERSQRLVRLGSSRR